MVRWLAIFVDKHGQSRATMITPVADGDLPFGVDEFELGLPDYDGEPVTLIEMPADEAFRPTVVDVLTDGELEMAFSDLPAPTTDDD